MSSEDLESRLTLRLLCTNWPWEVETAEWLTFNKVENMVEKSLT